MNIGMIKVLFTDRCIWQNFRPSLLRLVDRLFTRRKRLGRKDCHLQQLVNSTLIVLTHFLMISTKIINAFDRPYYDIKGQMSCSIQGLAPDIFFTYKILV